MSKLREARGTRVIEASRPNINAEITVAMGIGGGHGWHGHQVRTRAAALVKGLIAALCLILGPLYQSDRDG